jgi:hypothetical protein
MISKGWIDGEFFGKQDIDIPLVLSFYRHRFPMGSPACWAALFPR